MSPTTMPRPGLRDVDQYASPQIDVEARLNTNECPHPLSRAFASDLAETVAAISLNRYPDGQMTDLRTELAALAGHTPEGTWAANGSNEILMQILLAYGGTGSRALLFDPTYAMHARLAWLTDTPLVRLQLSPTFGIGDEEMTAAIESAPNVIFVCSPNNPTGNAHPVASIERLAASSSSLVVVDEAYIEFGGETALPLVSAYPNVVITRTFSKAFALAGARIGYCLGSPSVVEDLKRVRLPYHLSSLTQAAGLTALRHQREAMAILESIRTQRDRIIAALRAMPGLTVFSSEANFVLFVPPRPAAEVWQGLLDRGVLVRDLSSVVPNALRVTAGAEREIDLFLRSLQEVLA